MLTVEERLRANNRRSGLNVYKTAFRLPHYDWWDELEVIHDTGCSNLRFFQQDISIIAGPHLPGGDISKVMTLGMITAAVANGQLVHEPAVEVEAVILSGRSRRMGPWVRVQAVLSPGQYIGTRSKLQARWEMAKSQLLYRICAGWNSPTVYCQQETRSYNTQGRVREKRSPCKTQSIGFGSKFCWECHPDVVSRTGYAGGTAEGVAEGGGIGYLIRAEGGKKSPLYLYSESPRSIR
ncbi:unnamed protein product [Penicillium pancosmium]